MNVALWIAQTLLMALFIFFGYGKTFPPIEDVVASFPSLADLAPVLIRFIGISELLGALGLMLPGITGIRPALTSLAAAGLGLVVVLAGGFHVMRAEYTAIVLPVIVLAVCGFVVYGRWIRLR